MSEPRPFPKVLDADFLTARHHILDIAAALDRIGRAPGAEDTGTHPRIKQIREALAILVDSGSERAKRVQMVFSRPYDPQWRG